MSALLEQTDIPGWIWMLLCYSWLQKVF